MTTTCSKSLLVWLFGHIPESLSWTEIIFFSILIKFSPVGVTRSQWRGGHRADGPALPARSSSGPCNIFWSFFLHFLKSKFASYLGSDFQHFGAKILSLCAQAQIRSANGHFYTQYPVSFDPSNEESLEFCLLL